MRSPSSCSGGSTRGKCQRTTPFPRVIPPNLEIDGAPTSKESACGPNLLDITPDGSIPSPVFLDKGDRTDCRSFTFRQLDLHRNMMTPSLTYGARWFASPWFLNIMQF